MESKLFELDAKMDGLRHRMAAFPARVVKDYTDKLDISWVFHDHAQEGVVLSYSELKAAVDSRIISDVTLIPMYEEVRSLKMAVDYVRDSVKQKKQPPFDFELIKKFYTLVTPEALTKGTAFRKENPLHRLYYHDICPPEKIAPAMKKLEEWMASSEFRGLHPVIAGAKLQWRLLQAYPWTKNTGKVARLLTNYLLLQSGYLPAIIHSIDRQRYYESLRHENEALPSLLLESLENSIETTTKFFEEFQGLRVKRAS